MNACCDRILCAETHIDWLSTSIAIRLHRNSFHVMNSHSGALYLCWTYLGTSDDNNNGTRDTRTLGTFDLG